MGELYTESDDASGRSRVPRVKVMGTRPSPSTPAAVMIGGLAAENEDQCWEWNLDGPSTKQHGPHVAYGLGVQPLLANYTVTMSFDWAVLADRGLPKTTTEEVEAVLALAKRHGVHPPYVMIGASMGGRTALMARTLFRHDVHAAIVVDAPPWSSLLAAAPTREYARRYPSAAARIAAAMRSWNLGEFKVTELRADRSVHCHVDVVPYDAPPDVQKTGRRKVAETESTFCRVTRHFGAGHAIMVTDPRVIVADALRYIQDTGESA